MDTVNYRRQTEMTMELLSIRNPGTGEMIKELSLTPKVEIQSLFERAAVVQKAWAMVPVKKRIAMIVDLRETLINHIDDLGELISNENGKPRFESMMN
jgi:succinate-semialdehyde dehydrogenase/glutarate-semialdehyde dehydrogenase